MAHVQTLPTEYHAETRSQSSSYKEESSCSETEVISEGISQQWSLFGNSIGYDVNVLEYIGTWYSGTVASYQSLLDQLSLDGIDSSSSLYVDINTFRENLLGAYNRFESSYQQSYYSVQQTLSSLDVNSATYNYEVSNLLIELEKNMKPDYGDLFTLLQPVQTASLIQSIQEYRSSQSTSTASSSTTQVTKAVSTTSGSNTAIQFLDNNFELSQLYDLGPQAYLTQYISNLIPGFDEYIERLKAVQITEEYADYQSYMSTSRSILDTWQSFDSLYGNIVNEFSSAYQSFASMEESVKVEKITTLLNGYGTQLNTYWPALLAYNNQLPTLLETWENVSVQSQTTVQSTSARSLQQATTTGSSTVVNSGTDVLFLGNAVDFNQLNSIGLREYLWQTWNQRVPNMADYMTRLNSLNIDQASCSDVSKLNAYNTFSQNAAQVWSDFNSVFAETVGNLEVSYNSFGNLEETERVTKLTELFSSYDYSRLDQYWSAVNSLYTDLPSFLEEYESYSTSRSSTTTAVADMSTTAVGTSSTSIQFLDNSLDLTQLCNGPRDYLLQYRRQILQDMEVYISRLNAIQISEDNVSYGEYNAFVQNLFASLSKFDSLYDTLVTEVVNNYQGVGNLEESVRIEKVKTWFASYASQFDTVWPNLYSSYKQLPTLMESWENVSVQSSQSTTRAVQQDTGVISGTSGSSVAATDVRFLNYIVNLNDLNNLGPERYLLQLRNTYFENIEEYLTRLNSLQMDNSYQKYDYYRSFTQKISGLWEQFSSIYGGITQDLVANYQTIVELDQSTRIVKLNGLFANYGSQLETVWNDLIQQYSQLQVNLEEWEKYSASRQLSVSKSSRKSSRSAAMQEQEAQHFERNIGSAGANLGSQQYSASQRSLSKSSSLNEEEQQTSSIQKLGSGLGGIGNQYSASQRSLSQSSSLNEEEEQTSIQNLGSGLGGIGNQYAASQRSLSKSSSLNEEEEQTSIQNLGSGLGGYGNQYAASQRSLSKSSSFNEEEEMSAGNLMNSFGGYGDQYSASQKKSSSSMFEAEEASTSNVARSLGGYGGGLAESESYASKSKYAESEQSSSQNVATRSLGGGPGASIFESSAASQKRFAEESSAFESSSSSLFGSQQLPYF